MPVIFKIKRSRLAVGVAGVLLLAGALTCVVVFVCSKQREKDAVVSLVMPLKTGVMVTPVNSHKVAGPEKAMPGKSEIGLSSGLSLQEALSVDKKINYSRRRDAIRALPAGKLSDGEVYYLSDFVRGRSLPDGMTPGQMRALKNQMLNVLCAQSGHEQSTATMLRAVYFDKEQDMAMRDYALQHLATLAERDPGLGWETHWRAISDANMPSGATALLHLARRHQNNELSSEERVRLEAAALEMVSYIGTKDPSRATALRVCGQLQLKSVRSVAWDYAHDETVGMPLRIAAVATLGDLGDDADIRSYLATLTAGPEQRLRSPASAALRRLSVN